MWNPLKADLFLVMEVSHRSGKNLKKNQPQLTTGALVHSIFWSAAIKQKRKKKSTGAYPQVPSRPLIFGLPHRILRLPPVLFAIGAPFRLPLVPLPLSALTFVAYMSGGTRFRSRRHEGAARKGSDGGGVHHRCSLEV